MKSKVKYGTKATVVSSVVLILMAMMIVAHADIPSEPHAADAIWVEPNTITLGTGDIGKLFNITVSMNMTESIFSYQFALYYNRTVLKGVAAGYTGGGKSNYFSGHTTSSAPPVIDTATTGNGSVLAFETLQGNDFATGHAGTLAWIEFQLLSITVPPGTNVTCTFDLIRDNVDGGNTWWTDVNANFYTFTNAYNGQLVITGPAPPLAVSIAANATSITMGQSVGFTSTVTGGSPPYSGYQWFLNSSAVSGATSGSWNYTPASAGSANIYLSVTDSKPTTAVSNLVTITILPTGVSPLAVSIAANATSITMGQSVGFTSTVTGGSPPYSGYQWFLNSSAVSGATSGSWNYTPASAGSANIYLNVTDTKPTTAKSNLVTITITAKAPPPTTEPEINVYPPEIFNLTLVPSSIFSIVINLTGVQSLSACQFNLTFDPQVLNWVGMQVLRVEGEVPVVLAIASQGSIWVNLNYGPSTPISADPPEPIVTIYFHVVGYGTSPLNLTDTILLDSSGNPINPHSESDGLFTNGKVDLAVTNVVPALTFVVQGSTDNVNVTVANLGSTSETFNASAYYNGTLIGNAPVTLASSASTTVTIPWDTTGVPAGNYTITGVCTILPGDSNITNNEYTFGQPVEVTTLIHDVAVTDITPLRAWGYEGYPYYINVTTLNDGNFTESFNVTVYADSTTIGTYTINGLPSNTANTTTIDWNTSSAQLYHNYTLSARASFVPDEFNLTNNYLVDGMVSVRLPGDVNGDQKVDGRDLTLIALAFGSQPGSKNWNPGADINGDNKVDGRDIEAARPYFGKTYP